MKNDLEMIPGARRLIVSLRDMGYDFAAAVGDIVDNSVEAGATIIAVDVEFDGDNSWVRISDNGKGMSPAELREAMRYGAERDYEEDDLGKFGLGLKVASLSQCQRLSVASRTSKARTDIAGYCWDLDHIKKTNRWELRDLRVDGMPASIRELLAEGPGTVVLWERLDRLLGYQLPYGEHARKRLSAMCREAEDHLAMVFHRFLCGEAKGRKRIKILVNGNEVLPWDPFSRDESATKELTPVPIKFEHEGVSGYVLLEPYVLPHQSKFSSMDAFRKASGPGNWNMQQGFYIYRSDRLIQSGGWSRLRTNDEHTKLARIALRFSPQLDEAFKVNVAKMRVQLPAQIRDQIERAVKPVIKLAQEAYRREPAANYAGARGGAQATTMSSQATGVQDPAAGGRRAEQGARRDNAESQTEKLQTFDQFVRELLSIADSEEREVIGRVLKRRASPSSR